MKSEDQSPPAGSGIALWMSTIAMGVCFAVWTIYSIFGVEMQSELGISDAAFGVLVATPILTGSLSRLALGIWAEMFGGRLVYTLLMLVVAASAFILPYASSYTEILAIGLGLGLAGGSFSVGVAYVLGMVPAFTAGIGPGAVRHGQRRSGHHQPGGSSAPNCHDLA